jgi:hypothetical protein
LGGKIIHLVGRDRLDGIVERRLIRQIAFDDLHLVEDMLEPVEALEAGPSDHAIDSIAFPQEEFREIRAILPGDARD